MKVNRKAIIQAVDYIIKNASDADILDKLSILKLLFFAERYSLRKYAQSITNDTFFAMQKGPVASTTYDMMCLRDKTNQQLTLDNILQTDGEYGIKSNGKLKVRDDYDELSDADLESLNFSIREFGTFSSKKLVDITHRFKEWNRFEDLLKVNNTSYKIVIEDFFEETTDDTNEFNTIPNEHVKLSKELFINGDFFD